MRFHIPNFLVGYALGALTVGVIESIRYSNIYFVIVYMILLIIMEFVCTIHENKKIIDNIKVEPMVFYPAACNYEEFKAAVLKSQCNPKYDRNDIYGRKNKTLLF